MNIFKTFTLKWWQGSIFKISMAAVGVILGVYFQDFFLRYIALVTAVAILGAIYITSVWLKQ